MNIEQNKLVGYWIFYDRNFELKLVEIKDY